MKHDFQFSGLGAALVAVAMIAALWLVGRTERAEEIVHEAMTESEYQAAAAAVGTDLEDMAEWWRHR